MDPIIAAIIVAGGQAALSAGVGALKNWMSDPVNRRSYEKALSEAGHAYQSPVKQFTYERGTTTEQDQKAFDLAFNKRTLEGGSGSTFNSVTGESYPSQESTADRTTLNGVDKWRTNPKTGRLEPNPEAVEMWWDERVESTKTRQYVEESEFGIPSYYQEHVDRLDLPVPGVSREDIYAAEGIQAQTGEMQAASLQDLQRRSQGFGSGEGQASLDESTVYQQYLDAVDKNRRDIGSQAASMGGAYNPAVARAAIYQQSDVGQSMARNKQVGMIQEQQSAQIAYIQAMKAKRAQDIEMFSGQSNLWQQGTVLAEQERAALERDRQQWQTLGLQDKEAQRAAAVSYQNYLVKQEDKEYERSIEKQKTGWAPGVQGLIKTAGPLVVKGLTSKGDDAKWDEGEKPGDLIMDEYDPNYKNI